MPDANSETPDVPAKGRRSARPHRPRYVDNALTGNEVFDLLDDYICDTSGTKPPRRKRRKPCPTPAANTPSAQPPSSTTKPAVMRPRWYNQMYVMFLALRQSPNHTSSRSNLVREAVALDSRISQDRGLPRAFTGKTPMNSASALLTNNGDRCFVQFRPEGARCFHFRLAFKPGDFASALKAYEEWIRVLVDVDWPVCFGPEPSGPEPNAPEPNGLEKNGLEPNASETNAPEPNGLGNEMVVTSDMAGLQPRAVREVSNLGTVPDVHLDAEETPIPDAVVSESVPSLPESVTPLLSELALAQNTADASIQSAETPLPNADIPKSWHDVVEVRESTIPNAGNGLFAKRDLPAGIPLGFYFGVPMTEDEFDSLKESVGLASHYSIMYRKTVLDATDDAGMPYTDPDGPLYCPFHFMNEARVDNAGSAARFNITFLEGVKVNQIICLTARAIEKGEELFVSYGDEVDRSHWDGKHAVLDVEDAQVVQDSEPTSPRTCAMRAAASTAADPAATVDESEQDAPPFGIPQILKSFAATATSTADSASSSGTDC
ncbi:hypothetical protein GGH15_004043 [Coemansia sp. RSA 562]|nr:hypothetical protein GGH15_004043 [Coemansia sp. RSA 562]